jgi:hypothetical protein
MKKQLLSLSSFILVLGINAQAVPSGSSSNAYTILRPAQNQVSVDTATNTIIFIHRQNIALTGEGAPANGKLRYSVSTDGGLTFAENVGVINSSYSQPARYPQVMLYNSGSAGSLNDLKAIYSAPTLNSGASGWNGHVMGVSNVVNSNPTATENYNFLNQNTGLGGGLTMGVNGEFWMVETGIVNDSLRADSIIVYKGIYNSANNDVNWSKFGALQANLSKTYDGIGRLSSANIAFSPDGQKGWIAAIGDLIGGSDSIYQPVLWNTTDGGATWNGPIGVELMNVAGLMDSLNYIRYLDQNGDTIYAAAASTSFDFDITVDADGNPHFFTIIVCGEIRNQNNAVVGNGKSYSSYSGMNKFAADLTTTTGGATWKMNFISPVNTFRTSFPGDLSVDNQPQVGRSTDGQIIFFSWSDSDTLLVGQTNDNTNPNLRVSALRVSDGFQTCYRRVESNPNEDNVFAPTMSPTVYQTGSIYYPAIITGEFTSDDLNPVNFYYMGNISRICESDFKDPNTLDLSWSFQSTCYTYTFCQGQVSIEEQNGTLRASLYPNPAQDKITIQLEQDLRYLDGYTITNLAGQQVVAVDLKGSGIEGHYISVSLETLSNGFYILNLISNGKTNAHKFAVSK